MVDTIPEPEIPDDITGPARQLWDLFAAHWNHKMETNPTYATYLADFRFNDRIEDLSRSAWEAEVAANKGFLAQLITVPRDELSTTDQLNYDLFENMLEMAIEDEPFQPWMLPMNQMFGPHIEFPQLVNFHPWKELQHVKDFVSRMRAFPEQVDQIIECMRSGIEAGRTQPPLTIEGMIQQCGNMVTEPEASPFYGPIKTIREENRFDLGEHGTEFLGVLADSVMPAYIKLQKFLQDEYLPEARPEPGIWCWEDGTERYIRAARYYTTTSMTPEQIHELGQKEVSRIRDEMKVIMKKVGFEGTLSDFFAHLKDDKAQFFEDREPLLQGFRDILEVMDEKLPAFFGILPRAEYEVRSIEEYREKAAPAAFYYQPPEDGSRPGIFYANTYKPEERPRYTMEALAYHEAVPGHHLQIAIAMELPNLPRFRKHGFYNAYIEGWGLYSEWLGVPMGFYTDPYQDFGRLIFEIWRAVRLVVDTGVHWMRWTRDDAIAFMKNNTSLGEVDVIAEIDRYIAWPGQALGYKVGERKINGLRARAQEKLGDRFDWRSFHDEVLGHGALPLDLFEKRMTHWIETQAS